MTAGEWRAAQRRKVALVDESQQVVGFTRRARRINGESPIRARQPEQYRPSAAGSPPPFRIVSVEFEKLPLARVEIDRG